MTGLQFECRNITFKETEHLISGPEERWNQFKETGTVAVIGSKTKQYQDWFDDMAIQALLDDKRKAYIDWQNHKTILQTLTDLRTVERELRNMQNKWWEQNVEEVQRHADSNNAKKLFSAIKSIYGPSKDGTAP